MLLGRMRKEEFPFQDVRALSGGGQQHGSVYWANGASETLSDSDADGTLTKISIMHLRSRIHLFGWIPVHQKNVKS